MANHGDNMLGLKRTNRSTALKIIHESETISRKQLAEKMNLTPAAVTKIIAEMIGEGLVREGKAISGGSAGRREIEITLDSKSRCALGLFINLRQAVISAVWLDGTVIFSREIAIEESADADSTVDMLCGELMSEAGRQIDDMSLVLGVGIAIRGIVSEDGELSVDSFGALSEKNFPAAEKVRKATGLDAVMVNNVRALFAANTFLLKSGSVKSSFFLRCEYGIGAALTIDGRLWNGSSQQCSEIGHIPVLRSGGKLCSCGKRGCLETVASPGAIIADVRDFLASRGCDRPDLTLEEVFEISQKGDSEVKDIVDNAVSYLALALKAAIYTIDPSEIVLYGKMFNNSYYLSKLMAEMEEGVDPGHNIKIYKSPYNLLLEDKAAGLVMVQSFINAGGL